MIFIYIFISILLFTTIPILFVDTKLKGFVALVAVIANSLLSGFISIQALQGQSFEVIFAGNAQFGAIPIKIDALSAWFILTINFTIITGAVYGLNYMKQYIEQKNNITVHCISYILLHISLLGVCSVQNGMIFLLFWEVMALSAFMLVIFEHYKADTLKAGINYLVQSHISIIFLMLGFIYVAFKTNSYDFQSIASFASSQTGFVGVFLFLCFFVGFGIKAGFVPFHTWLPYAHPVAPSHVSGVMSGVLIKIGIYGILRMLLLIKTDYTIVGSIILLVSVISGIYGVMLAIIQHNIKRLLAYHSIENIGIIGIGIGVGCIGLGTENNGMSVLGFSGALLHTLNHSLFKSLLFYSAGNVYQATHTLNIERLGGIIKQMPHTALLFLIAALAICGLPPLNGFISEFLIYGGLYSWLFSAGLVASIVGIFSILGLVIIGGLAILCFTKAFGIIFLGTLRKSQPKEIKEVSFWQLFPMYSVALLMVGIGLFPTLFINILAQPVTLFTQNTVFNIKLFQVDAITSLYTINWYFAGFIALVVALAGIRKIVNRNKKVETSTTWGCGYETSEPKLQYTASSFVRTYIKLFKPLLDVEKKDVEIEEVFPTKKHYETHPYDKIERYFIDKPMIVSKKIFGLFTFLQNGRLQMYILYGIIFITAILSIPYLADKIAALFHFLNHL